MIQITICNSLNLHYFPWYNAICIISYYRESLSYINQFDHYLQKTSNFSRKPASAINNSLGSVIVKLLVAVQSLASVMVTLYVPGDKSLKSGVVALYELSPVLVQA